MEARERMDAVPEHYAIEDSIELTQRILAKHPEYMHVCVELNRQADRMRAYNAVLRRVEAGSAGYAKASGILREASWEVMALNETKIAMERSALSDVVA